MKKKFIMIAVLLVTALVLFVSCEDVQKVEIQYSKSAKIASLTVTEDSDTPDSYILTWDAVKNVSYYTVYVRQAGKKDATQLGAGTNLVTYTANGIQQDNTDMDKWTYYSNFGTYPNGTYEVGVRTFPLNTANATSSDIVWSKTKIIID